MKTKTLAIVLIVVVVVVAVGVVYLTTTGASPFGGRAMKVGMLFLGKLGDGGWNSTGYEGLTKAKDQYGLDILFAEDVPFPDMEAYVRDYASKGCDLIIGHSSPFNDPMLNVAKEYPDTKFIITQGTVSNGTNVATYYPRLEETAYLAGALAALMSKTNTIGFVGGVEYDTTRVNLVAFEMGAKAVSPNVTVLAAWTGSWDDSAKGKETALSMIAAGADVIQHQCAIAGLGVVDALKEKGVYGMVDVADMNYLAPDLIISSTTTDYVKYVVDTVGLVKNGTFEGKDYRPGIKEGAISLAPYHDLVPQNVADRVEQLRQDIVNGKISIPGIK